MILLSHHTHFIHTTLIALNLWRSKFFFFFFNLLVKFQQKSFNPVWHSFLGYLLLLLANKSIIIAERKEHRQRLIDSAGPDASGI